MRHCYPIVVLLVVLCLNIQTTESTSECDNVVCPEQVICQPPKTKLVLPYPGKEKCCVKVVCTCKGTNSELTSSGSREIQYSNLEKLYTNCTLVNGNLELTGLFPFGNITTIEFTKHIEQVTGYLLIYRTIMDSINLSSLRLIRGLTQYYIGVDCRTNLTLARDQPGYSVYANRITGDQNYLRELWMPKLTEISAGNVFFTKSRICNLESIKWRDEIFNDGSQTVEITNDPVRDRYCDPCPSVCRDDSGSTPVNRCWGNSSDLCQLITKSKCRRQCGNDRCNAGGACCNGKCAGGCYDNMPATGNKDKWCHACKDMNNNGTCVEACPQGTQMNPTSTITKTPKTYQFARYCVPKCPFNVPQTTSFCRTYCPEGTFDYNSNICEPCENGKCEHVCYGLGVGHGPLKDDKEINSENIKYFNKNCTIIEGSLSFQASTFNGDSYCSIGKLNNLEMLSVFENVKEITGYLAFDEWRMHDLCLFKNLKKIRGKELKSELYSLYVYTNDKSLRELCLNSLENIYDGGVFLSNEVKLCFTNTINWPGLFNQGHNYVANNKPPSSCGGVLVVRNPRLGHTDTITWENIFSDSGNQNTMILRNQKEVPCHTMCDQSQGCWGRDATNCVRCQYYTDYTDVNGQLTPAWVTDQTTGLAVPGYNTTTCVEQCNQEKGVYASSDMRCLPCDSECLSTCNGPTSYNCTSGCQNFKLNSQCVPSCPLNYYIGLNKTCSACSPNCVGGCTGPLDIYGEGGCSSCHVSMDEKTSVYTHRGAKCPFCLNDQLRETCAHGCTSFNNTGRLQCYYLPKPDITVYIIIGVMVFIFIFIVISWVFYKHRKTIKRMRQTIGETMVGERIPLEPEAVPLTPSGAAPNVAQLRIVKESELEFRKMLGSGAFGTVQKAIWTPLNIQGEKVKIAVAVKTLKTSEDLLQSANNEIMDEAYMMASVECPYLVRLLGISMTEQVALITQLMPLGSLLEYVRNPTTRDSIRSRQILSWCVQIAKGMKYLEEKHLVHRDLAARNVLVKTPNHVKITDFGLAKMLDTKEEIYHAEGGKLPIKWLAIECITEREFSHLSDVWAFGVTCWELLTFGARPYEGVRAVDVLSLLERGDRLPQPATSTIDIYMVLVKCWMVDRLCRPSFSNLVDEFSKMAADPSRFVVIKHDDTDNIMSPTSVDDASFFRQLMEDEKTAEEDLIADEPDEYLLNLNHPDNLPKYANIAHDPPQHPDQGARDARLFSRNTPSSFPESSTSSSTAGMRAEPPVTPQADPDDVFSEVVNSVKTVSPHPASVEQQATNRKDSEETQRYTEDPTTKRPLLDGMQSPTTLYKPNPGEVDENNYLLPTPLKKQPDYFDPSHVPSEPQPSPLLCNETYVEGDSLPESRPYPGQLDNGYAPICGSPQEHHDYVNTDSEARNPMWFSNEEYMATDSGIGEDVQSLLSRGNTANRGQRRSNQSQSSVDDSEQIFLQKDAEVPYRPQQNRDSSPDSQKLNETSLNNPEYMFLNPGSSGHPQT
uniref:epidermal growth factor receptor isoform X4 n=1 Tax=Ciona intestinalis TaxID=7719 RepID=UPI00089DC1CD|nr:epidermal growth factor receptor isoform X4 [Ciona intestinalis]|eukprot:XP_018671332.1 epidermal growth factor receptor isoform X4 [Ciona intestinalis]